MKPALHAVLLFATLSLPTLASAQTLQEVKAAAEAKSLPTKILQEIIDSGARITIRHTDGGAYYVPGLFGGGTIYLAASGTPASQWIRGDFYDFYNEAFSAWWGNVFTRSSRYAPDRAALLNNAALTAKYRRANPGDPALAQEEGYSETLASTITMAYPQVHVDPDTGAISYVTPEYETLYYSIGWTVAAVGHSDRPGYTPEAEDTYLDETEYDYLMRWVFDRPAPVIP